MDYEQYGKILRQEKQDRKRLQTGLTAWLETRRKGFRIYPATLECRNGPWLYDREKGLDRIAGLQREVGVFLERIYRIGVRRKDQRREGWMFVGWPDHGANGFVHMHGFILIHKDWPEDFPTWLQGLKDRAFNQDAQSIGYCHISPEITDVEDCARYGSYAAKTRAHDMIWYQAGQGVPVIQWKTEKTKTGWTIWTGGGFDIVGGKLGTPWRVKADGRVLYSNPRLDPCRSWCEQQA